MSQKPLSPSDIEKMRKSCAIAADTLRHIEKYIQVGISTLEIDRICNDFMRSRGAVSACLGYNGYPRFTCISLNDVVCHGVPSEADILKDGDILNVDVTALYQGFFGDTSKMFTVGTIDAEKKELIEVAFEAREKGIAAIKPHGTTGDIGFEINKYVTRRGYTAVKEIGGHGVGAKFHMDPFVPSIGKKGKGEPLIPWTCITVEPMINQGIDEIEEFDIPGSTVKYYHTADGLLSAQFEHTVLITDTGFEILTL